MYKIMLVKSRRPNCESLYQFMTTTTDGRTRPLVLETKKELDRKVERMLNKDGYSKADFIVVEEISYNIGANIYDEDEDEEETTTDGCNCPDVATDEEVNDMLDEVFGSAEEDSDDETEDEIQDETEE